MELLIIPIFLSVGVFFLNRSERKTEREIAKDHQQEAALKSYLDQMTELLLEKSLRTTKKAEVRDVARTLTINVLPTLDGIRKGRLVTFLYEAKLINKGKRIVELEGADLTSIDLSHKHIFEADLSYTYLNNANFEWTTFIDTKLSPSNIDGVNMKYSNLFGVDLSHESLVGADLRFANLCNANLMDANLKNTDMRNANLGHGRHYEFSSTSNKKHRVFDAKQVNMANANLEGADLRGANITEEQLESIKSLKGTIMPDGTKHV
jgi:uncharacterized protein YjbI with pentapeptide repeats